MSPTLKIYCYMFPTKHQDDTLSGSISSVDIATKENLKNLVKTGKQLLKKTVSMVNSDTGIYEPVENAETNEVALKR